MNITIICDVLGSKNNGTSLAAYNLIDYLKSKGHNVKVVCCDENKKNEDGFYVLPSLNFGHAFNNYIKKNGVVLAKSDKKIIKEACKDADIVHSMMPFNVGISAAKYCRLHHIPITSGFHVQAENVSSHVFMMNRKLPNHLIYKFMYRKYYSKMSAIHFPTEFIRDLFTPYNKRHVPGYVISNGVQLDLFYKNKIEKSDELKNKYVIIMSGRLAKEKNQKQLINAVKRSKYEKDIQILFTGSGPRQSKLEKLGRRLTNKPIFRLYSHEDLHTALWMGDLYVHTSYAEIEAISCLEAFACGLVPVISDSKKSATSKFALSDKNSYCYKATKDLTKKINYWIEHPEEKEEFSVKYAEFAKNFKFIDCMSKMEEMLVEVKESYENKKR